MPNWCENHVHFYHSKPEMIEAIKKSPEKGGLFSAFFPVKEPDTLAAGSESSIIYVQIEEWGTKWDVDEFHVIDSGVNYIVLNFSTAWSPPIEFYDKMCGIGFQVNALFHESGCGILGSYADGIEENYPYPCTHEEYENLPEEFENAFGIYSYWEEEGIEEYANNL